MIEISKEHIFTSIKEEIDWLNLKGKKIVLKLDVDGAEWMALKTLPIEYLPFIDQMVIIFHNPHNPQITPASQGHLTILESLRQHFLSVNFHIDNHECIHDYNSYKSFRKYRSSAIEVTLVNKNLVKLNSEKQEYSSNRQNVISTIMQFDCQMREDD
jgi:hypothetical protein